jgi:hypothetical protein
MLVRLTKVSGGGEIYINPDQVVAVEQVGNGDDVMVHTTQIFNEGRGRSYQVQGPLDKVAVALGADRKL